MGLQLLRVHRVACFGGGVGMDAGKAVHIRRGGLLPLVLQVPLMGIRQPGENARLYQDARRCSRSRGAQGQYCLLYTSVL